MAGSEVNPISPPPRSLGVVVARRQSKRLPGKILRPLLGHPLIAYMARAAMASRLDRVVLSTDDDEIAETAARYGLEAPFRRPAALAADFAHDHEIVLHALDWVEAREKRAYDIVVMLQPTTPFTLPRHIDACLEILAATDASCCFAARPVAEKPQWMFTERPDGTSATLLEGHLEGARQHSQNLPPAYLPSGAAWAVRTNALRAQQRIYAEPLRIAHMERERSVDIDEALDLTVAEAVGRANGYALVSPERPGG
ncbi:MAG: cytidylyltransferase domain-containing protein [Alphaproteobacteria bacterium]